MSPGIIIAIVVALIVIGVIVWLVSRTRRTHTLKESFGPEYDRVVGDTGSRREAENILVERRKRVEALDTRPLTRSEQQHFTDVWRNVQAKFVDDPSGAVNDADRLIGEVMSTRGYPHDMYEQRTDVASVAAPDAVQDYRTAHEIALRNQGGQASTEDLRSAMIQYRSLFERLVQEVAPEEATSEATEGASA
jgi:hypothetical protein